MKRIATKKVLIIALAVVAIFALTTVSFAAWTNKLDADEDFVFGAAEVTHLIFGGEGTVPIDGLAEPNKTMTAVISARTTFAALRVTFRVAKIEVRLSKDGILDETFTQVDTSDRDIFSLSVTGGGTNNTLDISSTASQISLNFIMKGNAGYKYANAEFRLTVAASGRVIS